MGPAPARIAGEALRFAALRGQEPFRVVGSAWPVERESNRAVITVLAPLGAGADPGAEARPGILWVAPLGPRAVRLDVGVQWR